MQGKADAAKPKLLLGGLDEAEWKIGRKYDGMRLADRSINERRKIMKKQPIATQNAPQAIGPYSQAITFGDLIFTSGQLPLDPTTGKMADESIKTATAQVIKNIEAILVEVGSSLDKVLKATVYLKDMNDFAAMNETYAEFFGTNPPARTTIQVAKLPMDVAVEIDVIASK